MGVLWGDSIDDAEAKRRGVPVAQVMLEKQQAINAGLEKQVAELKAKVSGAGADGGVGGAGAVGVANGAGVVSGGAKEVWASKVPAQWPTIHLANMVKLTQNRSMNGASASLIRLEDGRVFGVTARHLMGPLGGIDPALKLGEIDGNVVTWILHPGNVPAAQVRLGKLAVKLEDEGVHDCLMFPAVGDLTKLPGVALRPRVKGFEKGDRVFLLGCPKTEKVYRQNAYPGTVTTVQKDGVVNFTLDADLATSGFSGAPVVDEDGHFAGVYSGHYIPTPNNGTFREVYMVGVATVLELIPEKK